MGVIFTATLLLVSSYHPQTSPTPTLSKPQVDIGVPANDPSVGILRPQEGSRSSRLEASDHGTPEVSKPNGPSVAPQSLPDRFNEGVFQEKEQFHDLQIGDLSARVASLEHTTNWFAGLCYAVGFVVIAGGGLAVGLFKLFWKAAVRVILEEVNPRINLS